MLDILHTLILQKTLVSLSHFTDDKTVAHQDKVICQGSDN